MNKFGLIEKGYVDTDEHGFEYDNLGFPIKSKEEVERDIAASLSKQDTFKTSLPWDESDSYRERTVFGKAKKGLFYNYSDRLSGTEWSNGVNLALAKGLTPKTAEFFEFVLNYFHGTDTVDLQHVILGCNRNNGFSYLIFGYTYTEGYAHKETEVKIDKDFSFGDNHTLKDVWRYLNGIKIESKKVLPEEQWADIKLECDDLFVQASHGKYTICPGLYIGAL